MGEYLCLRNGMYSAIFLFSVVSNCASNYILQIGDKNEAYIVASGGSCAYVWSLNRVADATHDCYKICSDLKVCFCYQKHFAVDTVVDSSFQHWHERSLAPSLVLSTAFTVAHVAQV